MAQSIAHIDARDQSNRTNRAPIAPRWIRPTEFAAATGMSRRAVYNALADGTLKGVKVSTGIFFVSKNLTSISRVTPQASRNA